MRRVTWCTWMTWVLCTFRSKYQREFLPMETSVTSPMLPMTLSSFAQIWRCWGKHSTQSQPLHLSPKLLETCTCSTSFEQSLVVAGVDDTLQRWSCFLCPLHHSLEMNHSLQSWLVIVVQPTVGREKWTIYWLLDKSMAGGFMYTQCKMLVFNFNKNNCFLYHVLETEGTSIQWRRA